MGRAFLASAHLSDDATLTAGDELTSLEGTNLQVLDRTEKWRADTLANAYVDLDFGTAVSLRFFALLWTNARSATDWRVSGATSQGNLESVGYDSTQVDFWPNGSDLSAFTETHGWLLLDSAQTFRWWRVRMIDATHPDGYLEAGRLFLSAGFQPAIDTPRGWSVQPADERTTVQYAAGGGASVRQGVKRRNLTLRWDWLTEAEAFGTLDGVLQEIGTSRDVFVSIDPDEATYPMQKSVHGLVDGAPVLVNRGLWAGASGGAVQRYAVDLAVKGF